MILNLVIFFLLVFVTFVMTIFVLLSLFLNPKQKANYPRESIVFSQFINEIQRLASFGRSWVIILKQYREWSVQECCIKEKCKRQGWGGPKGGCCTGEMNECSAQSQINMTKQNKLNNLYISLNQIGINAMGGHHHRGKKKVSI